MLMEPTSTRPKKRRCVKERVRVTRACDACKRKKLRCSGTLPCSLCQRSSQSCEYTTSYTRGKVPPIPALHQPNGNSNVAERHIQERPGPNVDRMPASPDTEVIEGHSASRIDGDVSNLQSRDSPEPHQTDMEGHYVGPSSGVSFMLRIQKRLHESITFPLNTPIFSFGDAPLPKSDPSFLLLPSKNEAKELCNRYFDFAFPTHRFLHQQQVECWLDEFYNRLQEPHSLGPGEREIRALLLMVFAQASQYKPESGDKLEDTRMRFCEYGSNPSSSCNSAVYFGASEHHLATETGPVRVTSVQARLAQCFYLLSQSRINHCWSLFGTTARLAIAIGLHRKRRREHPSTINLVEQECSKRVFWCAYSLDNYLSAALGRPRIFHDDEIDQEFPEIAEDQQITLTSILPPTSSAQSIMLAPVYHAKLSRIISGVLHDLYGIHRSTLTAQASAAEKYGAKMTEWRKELSQFLDLPNVNIMKVTYQRQYTVLNLAFYHAQILLYRPFLLKGFTLLTKEPSRRNDKLQGTIDQNIKSCLEAAMKVVSIVHDLSAKGRMYRAFWVLKFTHYYAFSAIVVLYVHYIRSRSRQSTTDADMAYYMAGKQGQDDLASCGSQSSFSQRYVMVLEELRKEAHKATIRGNQESIDQPVTNRPDPGATEGGTSRPGELDPLRNLADSQHTGVYPVASDRLDGIPCPAQVSYHGVQPAGSFQFPSAPQESEVGSLQGISPESYIADLASWGEFDSLAATGLGDFGNLFPQGRNMSTGQVSALLAPVVALNIWTFVMEGWMYQARIPVYTKMNIKNTITKRELDAMTPASVRWKADNYNHLMEQPTQFYAIALVLALAGKDDKMDILLAWSYVAIRIVHSLVQSTSNHIMSRFSMFVFSSGILAVMTGRAALLVF
ncbi:fungal-specific transcription factor domain-containing protein [Aspergillus pseudotamarii]|uniref:Fungal-specific transcription factor domain-containing protein n=1 Tax=Aspergillus pseudotamarii TaxID=132259 RepID=A0A5N6SWD1_ASPPS|nr:fungal-specific transcription factor domain-containing protein [Aspergillus pseudotamarii]KAE8138932.1 fungal-specific transcription factor domain-containing protein [Aspergillus pseudotamarii]